MGLSPAPSLGAPCARAGPVLPGTREGTPGVTHINRVTAGFYPVDAGHVSK